MNTDLINRIIFFVGMCILPAIALLVEYRTTRNLYVLIVFIMDCIFGGAFIYLGFFTPQTETARLVARWGFILNWGLSTGASAYYLAARWNGINKA